MKTKTFRTCDYPPGWSCQVRIFLGQTLALLGVAILLIVVLAPSANAQVVKYDETRTLSDNFERAEEVPKAALLTKRGRQLADRLRHLRHSESTMGPKHPSLKVVQNEIMAVKEQLAAWTPGAQEDLSDRDSRPLPQALSAMNEADLKELILRMAAKIDQLERRLFEVETHLRLN